MSQEATAQTLRERTPQLVESIVYVVIALVVLFTATLHEVFGFTALLFAISVAALSFARLCAHALTGNKRVGRFTAQQSFIDSLAALATILFAKAPADLALIMSLWAGLTFVTAIFSHFHVARKTVAALLLPAALTVLLLWASNDLVALIGWFGAYAVVVGVFGAISAFDTPATEGTELDVAQQAANQDNGTA